MAQLSVPAGQVATLFSMNIRSWKHQAFVRQHYPQDLIAEMERELDDLSRSTTDTPGCIWARRYLLDYQVRTDEAEELIPRG